MAREMDPPSSYQDLCYLEKLDIIRSPQLEPSGVPTCGDMAQ